MNEPLRSGGARALPDDDGAPAAGRRSDPPQDEPASRGEAAPDADEPGATSRAPFVLGIIGDSGSGKNTVADAVAGLLGTETVTDVRLDDYHKFTREERAHRGLTPLNPVVHDFSLMEEHLGMLRQGKAIRNRSYSHADGTFGPVRTIEPHEIVLVRGLLGLPTLALQKLYDLAVFLRPEPELLFRWKLRRDVLCRGYTEAEVLKSIANHLLDAKEYVLPQAERAHVLVQFELPDWEAPDAQVRTTIRCRRDAAGLARPTRLFAGLPIERSDEGDEVVLRIPPDIRTEVVDDWARTRFPETYDPAAIGTFLDETGASRRRDSLAALELVIACLGREMAAADRGGARP